MMGDVQRTTVTGAWPSGCAVTGVTAWGVHDPMRAEKSEGISRPLALLDAIIVHRVKRWVDYSNKRIYFVKD